MKKVTEPKILHSIERHRTWIKRKCALAEHNHRKFEELHQEVILSLYLVREDFNESSVMKPDGWVKRIVCNITSKHIRREILRGSIISMENPPDTLSVKSNSSEVHDFKVAISYMNQNFKDKDREIFSLYMLGEKQKDIAAIFEMETRSVTNRISVLKKELNQFLNKGLER